MTRGQEKMKMSQGVVGNNYVIKDIVLPQNTQKRLEALGMTKNTPVEVLNIKNHGTMIVRVRGTRFALGKDITNCITVGSVCI